MAGNYPITRWLGPLVVALLILCSLSTQAQQTPQFNQYMFNPMGVNPAYAGSRDVVSAVTLFRSQWAGFEGAPLSQTVAIHGPLWQKKLGLGLQVTNDQIGPRQMLTANASYAYRIRVGQGRLAFGLRSGIINYRLDINKITYRDSDDPAELLGLQSITKPNFDFGIFYQTTRFFAGAEVAHLNQPTLSLLESDGETADLARLQYHFTGTIGYAFPLSDWLVFRPSVLAKQAGTTPGFVDLNANFLLNKTWWLGAAIRPSYGAIFMTEYVLNQKLRLGYSFDYAFNPLFAQSYGSHEIFIGYDFNISRSKMTSPRYF